jgi:hypothetical protein
MVQDMQDKQALSTTLSSRMLQAEVGLTMAGHGCSKKQPQVNATMQHVKKVCC